MLMVNRIYYRAVKRAAKLEAFKTVAGISEEQIEKQRHLELAVRFLVHTYVPYNGTLDVEDYIDKGIIELARKDDGASAEVLISRTFTLLNDVAGGTALRRFEEGHHVGKVGLVGLEGIAVGVAKNLDSILALDRPHDFLRERLQSFWSQPQTANFTSPGLRGTTRIQRTVPFGELWFRP